MTMLTLHQAIQWIADNDEPTEIDTEVIESMLTVILVAEIYDINSDVVAKRIKKIREAQR